MWAGRFKIFFDISSNAIFVDSVARFLQSWHAPHSVIAIVAYGIGKGINTTLTFIPVIAGLFLFLSFLEDSGYMARAAFVMESFYECLGLAGKILCADDYWLWLQCTIGNGRQNFKLQTRPNFNSFNDAVYVLWCALGLYSQSFASAFFPRHAALLIFLLYILGIALALFTGFLLRNTVLKGQHGSLILELPSYQWPSLKTVWRQSSRRVWTFISRAGRNIVWICALIGGLNAIPVLDHHISNKPVTALAVVGDSITPMFHPMGIEQNNWPATVSLLTGILAKEVVVGTLNSLYAQQLGGVSSIPLSQSLMNAVKSVPDNIMGLGAAFKNPLLASEADHSMSQQAKHVMQQRFPSTLSAWCYLVFILLYFPCISTMAAMKRELGRGWSWFSLLWNTAVAYGMAVFCYQVGMLWQNLWLSITSMFVLLLLLTALVYLWQLRPKTQELAC